MQSEIDELKSQVSSLETDKKNLIHEASENAKAFKYAQQHFDQQRGEYEEKIK
jgi:FtsZ-binding cell division protein ZapB